MKTIKLLLCVLLTAISLNVFADEGRYQMIDKTVDLNQDKAGTELHGVYVLDTKTGEVKYCHVLKGSGVYCLKNSYKTNGVNTL